MSTGDAKIDVFYVQRVSHYVFPSVARDCYRSEKFGLHALWCIHLNKRK